MWVFRTKKHYTTKTQGIASGLQCTHSTRGTHTHTHPSGSHSGYDTRGTHCTQSRTLYLKVHNAASHGRCLSCSWSAAIQNLTLDVLLVHRISVAVGRNFMEILVPPPGVQSKFGRNFDQTSTGWVEVSTKLRPSRSKFVTT